MKTSEAKLKHKLVTSAATSGPGGRNYLQTFNIYGKCLCLNRFLCGFLSVVT